MLALMLDRLTDAAVDELVVATTDGALDDPIAALAQIQGVDVVRGSEHDVLDRFRLALDTHPADQIVRLTADCPLIDAGVINEALQLHARVGADYTSNTLLRTYPDGLDVEVVEVSALRAAIDEADVPFEREHVTPFIYRRPERFALAALRNGLALGDERWTVDTADDLEFIREIVDRSGNPTASWRTLLQVVGVRRPATEWHLRPLLSSDAGTEPGLLERANPRTWVLMQHAVARGTVSITVEDGIGVVAYDVPPDIREIAAYALQRLLEGDPQVRELRQSG